MLRVFVSLLAVVLLAAGTTAFAAPNKSSTLSQEVQPITCIYTTTATGDTISSSTDCDSYIAATLDTVEPRAGRPLLGGTLAPSNVTGFRVWVGGVWFTDGASPYLTVSGSQWTLDLGTLSSPLGAGEYTIVLEERILTNFLLRSVYENVLDIPQKEITRTDTDDGERITSTFTSDGEQQIVSDTIAMFQPGSIEQRFMPDAQQIIAPFGYGIYTVDPVPTSYSERWVPIIVGLPIILGIVYVVIRRTIGFGWLLKR